MLLLTLRGTPTLYYGDEIGMQDVPIPPQRVRDPFEKQCARARARPRSRAHADAVERRTRRRGLYHAASHGFRSRPTIAM